MTRLFAVAEAYYIVGDNDVLNEIAGVPEYGQKYFGEYTGEYPYQAANKAFTGLQKHMNKFHNKDNKEWFPGYDPENPPVIIFKLVDVGSDEGVYYQGVRVPHHQGERRIINADGRERIYRWDTKVKKLELD